MIKIREDEDFPARSFFHSFEHYFGEDAQIAMEIVERQRKNSEENPDVCVDWCDYWDTHVDKAITDGQASVLDMKGYRYNNKTTARRASIIIDWIFLAEAIPGEKRNRMIQAEREKKRQEREAEKEAKRQAREEKIRIRDIERTATISRDRLIKWRSEFANLWNEILSDDAVTLEEIFKLKKWLKGHKVRHDDHREFLEFIDSAVVDGVIDQTEISRLYEFAVNLIETIVPDDDVNIKDSE